jgi:hypothetical protein
MKEDLNAQGNELNYFVVACKLIAPANQHTLNLTVQTTSRMSWDKFL